MITPHGEYHISFLCKSQVQARISSTCARGFNRARENAYEDLPRKRRKDRPTARRPRPDRKKRSRSTHGGIVEEGRPIVVCLTEYFNWT